MKKNWQDSWSLINGEREGRHVVQGFDGLWGHVSVDGKITTCADYKEASNFREGRSIVRDHDNRLGIVDLWGRVIVKPKYDFLGDFHEGLAWACEKKKMGFIDRSGKIVIPFVYKLCKNFLSGLAEVRSAEKFWGVIDKTGKVIIEPVYKSIKRVVDRIGSKFVIFEVEYQDPVTEICCKWLIDGAGNMIILSRKKQPLRNRAAKGA